MTDQPPAETGPHVCKPGATVYYCPTVGETESDCHGGFDVCCESPELHQPFPRCGGDVDCNHPADEHSVYGCVEGCACEWMPRPEAPRARTAEKAAGQCSADSL
ncbi:hypothetical protein OG693_39385 (plasmid) [Streptomyces sp. NBC_01259]|uniref:hypothetical protein n=1 Tax=Streptomyces sp. NBC_01259 TaxID=2903800 RepID=UPI00324E3435